MPNFQVALTGDFLDARGQSAYGDIQLDLLTGQPHIAWKFLHDLAPRASDPTYWSRLYALEITPQHLKDVHGLIVLRPWVKPTAFAQGAQDLVVIGRSGAGYDKIDLDACTAHGVAVFNAPTALNHSTASAALLLMLALAKRLPQQERVARSGDWGAQAAVLGSEIEGRTLGIIGLGHTGRELARLVAPFHMRVLAYSPHADRGAAAALNVELTGRDELLRASDFVSLHCRLTTETRASIDSRALALLKPTACFINVARGELVDQPALVEALQRRRIAGAGLDVFATEPLPAGHPLTTLDNVILTPHWLASTSDVWQATGAAMARGMLRAARGQVPENVVNPQVLSRESFQRKLARFATEKGGPP